MDKLKPKYVPNMADTHPEAFLRAAEARGWVDRDGDMAYERDMFRALERGDLLARDTLTRMYSWAIPTVEAIQTLVELSPIVEIGAGGGYWSWLVNNNGGEAYPYDIEPGGNHYVDLEWMEVQRGGPEKVLEHPDATLFICWPDYGGRAAYESARLYQGNTLVYIGEWVGGCTGDERFFKLCGDEDYWFSDDDERKKSIDGIEQEFGHDITIQLPQFWGLHDSMYILRRL